MLITPTRKATPPPAAARSSTTTTLPALLGQITAGVTQLGAEFRVDRQKFQKLSQRLTEERFHLAVLGQFKRGKNTLLNALLGEVILPTAVVPLTAIPTFLHSGLHRQAQVIYQASQPGETFYGHNTDELTIFLTKFVTEAGNPKNQRGVSHVELFHPATLLRQGVVMIDTPGIGSTLRHNTEATLNFLPQCDAVLFLVSADPPITEVEVGFLKEVRSRVAHLFFILNKVDYLSNEERQAALCFFRNVLQDQVGIEGEPSVFCISARQGLQARQTGDITLWQQSGLAEVENHLLKFLVSDKTEVLQTALACKANERELKK
ncbi:MAG TPA: dynamin family protein [Anaerolineae bacterium]